MDNFSLSNEIASDEVVRFIGPKYPYCLRKWFGKDVVEGRSNPGDPAPGVDQFLGMTGVSGLGGILENVSVLLGLFRADADGGLHPDDFRLTGGRYIFDYRGRGRQKT